MNVPRLISLSVILVAVTTPFAAPACAAGEFDDVSQGHPSYYALTYVDTQLGTGILGDFWTGTIKGKRALTRYEFGYSSWKLVSALRAELLPAELRDIKPLPEEARRGLQPASISIGGKRALTDPTVLRSMVIWTEALVRDYAAEMKLVGAVPEAHLRDLARWKIKPLTLSEAVRKTLDVPPGKVQGANDLDARYRRFFAVLPNDEPSFGEPLRHPAFDTSQFLLRLGLDRYQEQFGRPADTTRRMDFASVTARLAFDMRKVCLYDPKRDDPVVKANDLDRMKPRRDLPPGTICGGPPLPRFFRPGDPVFKRLSHPEVLRSTLIWLSALYSEFADELRLMGEEAEIGDRQLAEMRRNSTSISDHLIMLSGNR